MPCGKPVVDTDLDPLTKAEEPEPEDSAVVGTKVLPRRHHPVEADVIVSQVGKGGQKPAVSNLSLIDVESVPLSDDHGRVQPQVGTDLGWSQPLNLIPGCYLAKVAGDNFLVTKNTGVRRKSRILKRVDWTRANNLLSDWTKANNGFKFSTSHRFPVSKHSPTKVR